MEKILIIDDERDILQVAEVILEGTYEIHSLEYLEDPVNQVKEISPDLILMDLSIPKIGGEKAVRLLKSDKETRNIKTFLFSANPEVSNITKETGADGYIMKPFKIKELKRFLEEKLKL